MTVWPFVLFFDGYNVIGLHYVIVQNDVRRDGRDIVTTYVIEA